MFPIHVHAGVLTWLFYVWVHDHLHLLHYLEWEKDIKQNLIYQQVVTVKSWPNYSVHLLYLPIYKSDFCISRPLILKVLKCKFLLEFQMELILSSQELISRR